MALWLKRVVFACVAAVMAAVAAQPAAAQDLIRRIIATQDADYSGFDYETIRNVDLAACQAACLDDNRCRAFTYNERARWCFLKSDFAALSIAPNAIAGRIVSTPVIEENVEQQRIAELSFLPASYIDEARRQAAGLDTAFTPGTRSFSDLVRAAATARSASDHATAANLFGAALAIADEDPKLWLEFGRATLARTGQNSTERSQIRERARAAAVNAYLRSTGAADRGAALQLVGQVQVAAQDWRAAIRTYRASLALQANATLSAELDRIVALYGFRILQHVVDADAASPRICVVFSDPLPVTRPGLADFVTVEGGNGLAIEPEESQICVDGVQHGSSYRIVVRAGLPALDGEVLQNTAAIDVFVRDRAAWAGFTGSAYVLPAGPQPTIPIQSVNADAVEVTIYRIGDRALAFALREGIFLRQLASYDAYDIVERTGEQLWEGTVEIDPVQNAMVTTAIPVAEALAEREPGVYVITARVPGTEPDYWEPDATQWFVISDLGLTTLSANDGVHVIVRSLATAQPVAGADLRLVARNNEVLGTAETDERGYAVFPPGLARGTAGLTPQLVVAETGAGDYAFLDLSRSAFDLTDRGVGGRPSPEALDVFLSTERGVYRPGETVHATAIVRDSRAEAVAGLPITAIIERPDGVEHSRVVLSDQGLGGYYLGLELRPDAMRGSWRLRLYTDPQGAPVAEESFLVEDFEPERLAFDLSTDAAFFDPAETTPIDIAARYLYGAPAPNLAVEGDIAIRPVDRLAAFPGYYFGRGDDPVERILLPIDAYAETDADGFAVLDVPLPDIPVSTRLFQGEVMLRLTDANGRAVERTLSLPVLPDGPRIGVRPLFDDGAVGEGGNAAFDVIAVAPDMTRTAMPNVEWNLFRIETDYQWYSLNGIWRWEVITTSRRIDSGEIDLAAGEPVRISAPVEWGSYRLELTSSGRDATSTTYEFYAGWYVANVGTDTPDVLQVALDKPAYSLGETARLRLDPEFAGIALVAVVDDRLISMSAVEVPADGTTVDLPITSDWGPGAYVTATLYRPMDIEAGRMPARALGLTWATVEPGDRDLDIVLGVAGEIRPRGPMTIEVEIANLPAGEEAYVAVAAVDLGILNITNYRVPAPADWYFGQRALGTEIRDLYGSLIDTTQGSLGRLRSGGDGGAVRLGAPPPTQKLIAFHSGIVEVDADGKATITFDLPDFNGTVRVMAQAWSEDGVGQASKDVFVRDPVVVATSVPRFLNTGDTSRMLVQIDNVAGPEGSYQLTIDADEGIAIAGADAVRLLSLTAGQALTLAVPIEATGIGDHQVRVTLVMPDGQALPKDFLLGVRPPGAPVTERSFVEIPPRGGVLTIDAATVAQFVPRTALVTVSAGGAARLDVPGVLAALDRYPYGCAEQLTSRAMPLLYLNAVAASIGIASDEGIDERIQNAIEGVLANQSSSGAFGLWGPYDDGDYWLDAYVTDFLGRAAEAGYEVPDLAMRMSLDNLANRVAYATDFSQGGEPLAYALYVLAKNGRASIGDLRYYAEARLSAFTTALGKAQLGAALALYGDRNRARTAFAAAVELLATEVDDRYRWRADYGTLLRDRAAVLTLAAEVGIGTVDLRALAAEIADERATRRWTSTQEDAWTLMAAAALIAESTDAGLAIDGTAIAGPLFASFYDQDLLAAPAVIANTGTAPVDAVVTAQGVPVVPPPAGGDGYTIERKYFLPDGTLADISTVAQNDRYVVTLTVMASEARSGHLLIVDPLPAGFEIENPNLSFSGDIGRYPWLIGEAYVEHTEARTDRFVAAVDRSSSQPLWFTVAYTVRAVSPGVFAHPGATVEDMYRPEWRANTEAGTVEVVGPTR